MKSFYVVNFTRHGHTSYYTRNQKRSVSILSNDRYLPILEFQIIRATFSLFFFFQFIVLFLKIFLYKLQNEGSIATSPLRDPSHSPNSKLPPFISSKHFLFFFFFHLNPSCTLQNPSKSLKILRCHATRLTVLVHLSILAIIPLTGSQPGRRKEAACAPWKRRQLVGWQREIGSTRSSQERGWRTARVLRGSPSVGMKASRAVTFRFGMGTEES